MSGGDFTQKRHRKEPIELQLTAMIDVFSMIVIFLIFGTVMGASEVVIPKDMMLPWSASKEGIDVAPRLVIGTRQVEASFLGQPVPIEVFRSRDGSFDAKVAELKGQIKAAVDKTPAASKTSGVLLSVVADQATPYEDVFSVIKVFREAGYNTLMFMAGGEGGK